MKPPVRYARAVMRSDDALGRGMEGALTLALFLGLGFVLDRWLGTTPLFLVVLPVLAAVGLFYSWRAHYFAAMDRHEADRRARLAARRGATPGGHR